MMKNTWKLELIQMINYLIGEKSLLVYSVVILILVGSVFNNENKYFPQAFLEESLYKLAEKQITQIFYFIVYYKVIEII